MKGTVTDLLNDLSARLGCDVLDKTEAEHELAKQFSDIQIRTTEVADEIKQLASSDDARSFTTSLREFLDTSRTRMLEAHRLKAVIDEKKARIEETQAEFSYLSAGRQALAEKVKHSMEALEQAQREYADYELRLGVMERCIETDRREMSALRRQLAEMKKAGETN